MEGINLVNTDIIKDPKKQLAHVKKVLDAIEKTIEGRIVDDVEGYEISTPSGKRRLDKIPMSELIIIREKYYNELERLKKMTSGKKFSRQVVMRF